MALPSPDPNPLLIIAVTLSLSLSFFTQHPRKPPRPSVSTHSHHTYMPSPPIFPRFPIPPTIMHHAVLYATLPPPPPPPPSPSPSAAAAADHSMLLSIFLALFLPCAGMSAVFVVYICLLWYSTGGNNVPEVPMPVKPAAGSGLSASELDTLPTVTGKELVMGTECAVCLDEIESAQLARLVPGCNHGFHLECADTWLSKHSACPVCRAKIDVHLPCASDNESESPC